MGAIWEAIKRFFVALGGLIVRLLALLKGGRGVPGDHTFENETGDLNVHYDMRIVNGEIQEGTAPQKMECKGVYIIYSVHDVAVANCQGFGGPNDGNNAACVAAEAAAMKVANGITCPEKECPKRIAEIFRGWSCKNLNPGGLTATGAVELKVECVVTN